MLKKALIVSIIIFVSLFLFISCDFLENELDLRSSSNKGKKIDSTTIRVSADSVSKLYDADNPLQDPPLTYTFSPDPLPEGVSMTGKLERDPGEYRLGQEQMRLLFPRRGEERQRGRRRHRRRHGPRPRTPG